MQQTFSARVLRTFDWDYGAGAYKILVENNDGYHYFVYYDNKLEVSVGSGLVVTYQMYGYEPYWEKLTNVANQKEANVRKWIKVN